MTQKHLVMSLCETTFHLHDGLVGDILLSGLLLRLHPSLVVVVVRYYNDAAPYIALEGARFAPLCVGEYVGLG